MCILKNLGIFGKFTGWFVSTWFETQKKGFLATRLKRSCGFNFLKMNLYFLFQRAALSDFDRFKLMKAKQAVSIFFQ